MGADQSALYSEPLIGLNRSHDFEMRGLGERTGLLLGANWKWTVTPHFDLFSWPLIG